MNTWHKCTKKREPKNTSNSKLGGVEEVNCLLARLELPNSHNLALNHALSQEHKHKHNHYNYLNHKSNQSKNQ